MKLNIGAGHSGSGDWKIDLHPFDERTKVVDVAVEPIPFEDSFFDEVEALHVLEHIPTQIRWRDEKGQWCLRFARVELMREIHRVLKPGGTLFAATPYDWPERWQDPTHVSVWTLETYDYFCGHWGGNQPGQEQREAYGINFQFKRIWHEFDTRNHQLLVKLQKP